MPGHELDALPRRITIGDTVTWDEVLADFPASASWVLSYNFTGPDSNFKSGHTAVGDDHRIVIDTTKLEVGAYDYQKKITDGTDTFTLERGEVFVDPDLSADESGVDRRPYAVIALENVEAVLKGKATKDQSSYSLNGRSLSRYSIAELQDWRAQLRSEVRAIREVKRRESGGKSHANVHLGFNNRV